MEENLGETYKVNQETTVYYRDDEVHPINGKWVQLNPFDNVAVVEMIRCAGEVPAQGGGLPIKSDGGSECWALPLTLKYKKKFLFLTTLEYIFCKTEAPEV